MPDDNDIEDTLAEFHLTGEQVFKDIQKEIANRKANSSGGVRFTLNDDDDGNNDRSNEKENHSTSNSRGARGGRSAASKTAASKSTASKSTASKSTASKPTTSGRGRGSSRGSLRATAGPSPRNGPNSTVRVQINA